MKRFSLVSVFLMLGFALLSGGCESTRKKNYPVTVPRFLFEAVGDEVGVDARLPISNVVLRVSPKAVITEYDITQAELVRSDLGPAVMFQLTQAASRDLYRMSALNLGRRIVTTVNGEVLAVSRMDRPIGEGILISYLEVPPADLPTLIENINKTCADLQKELAKKNH